MTHHVAFDGAIVMKVLILSKLLYYELDIYIKAYEVSPCRSTPLITNMGLSGNDGEAPSRLASFSGCNIVLM